MNLEESTILALSEMLNESLKTPTNFANKQEARSHKEDNEKVAPRNREQSFNGGPNGLSVKASGIATDNAEKIKTGISRVAVGPEKGDIVIRDIKRNRVRSAEQALNRKNAGQLDFAGTNDMLNYEVAPNQKSREYRKSLGMVTRENKKQEARSHKEDNEKVAPREKNVKNFGDLKRIPKRARYDGRKGWGNFDAEEIETYEKGITNDIPKYKRFKQFADDAEKDANYYNHLKAQWDDMASDVVKDKALNRDKLKENKLFEDLTDDDFEDVMTYLGEMQDSAEECSDNWLSIPSDVREKIDAQFDEIHSISHCIGWLKQTLSEVLWDEDELRDSLEESKNPENAEINDKIKKSFNGSTKHIDDIEKAGLNVFQNEKGKVQAIGKPEGTGMTKDDFKKSHPDMDYYNYMTKEKVKPKEVATGAFSPTNIFRDSTNFNKTIGGSDRTYLQTDDNGVSKAIPKRYKTGNSNTSYNPNEFPHKSLNGVASYEPLNNTELSTFKSDKPGLEYSKYVMDKAKDEYEKKKAEYDKINARVSQVRDRIAKSKENSKK